MNTSYYYNRIKNDVIALKQSYCWNNKESVFALKAAVAGILSMLLAYSLDLQQGYWACISSLIVMLPTAGATAKKSLYRFLGTCIGAFLAIFISGLFAQQHILYSIAIFLLLSFCMYKTVFSRYSYFWFLIAITSTIIMISAIGKGSPEDIVYIAFSRGFEVSIGIIVTAFLNLLVWPQYAAHDYYKRSNKIKNNYLNLVKDIFYQYLEGKYDFDKTRNSYYAIKEQINSLNEVASHAIFEIKTARRQKSLIILDVEKLTKSLNHVWDFFLSVKKFENLSFHKSYCQYIEEIFNISKKMLTIKHDFDKKTQLINLSDEIIDQINKRYLRKKTEGTNFKYEIYDVYLFQEFLLIINDLVDFSKNKIFFNSKTFIPTGNKPVSFFPEEIWRFEIFGKKQLLNVPILKYSMKVGLTVVAVIWLWQLFDIPSGGANMALAVLLILQPDIISTHIKGILRFLGCLCGALLGFAFLGLQIQSTFLLCICLLIVIYFSMYIYFKGGPGISYLGLQMALAFLVAVLPESHATLDTVLFLKRLLGIFFGVTIAWIINITIWNKDLLTNLKEQISFIKNNIAKSSEQLKTLKYDNLSPDLTSFYSSLNVLTDQKEITIENSFFINKYLKNIEKFFRVKYRLLLTDKIVVAFVNNINSKIKRNILILVKGVSDMPQKVIGDYPNISIIDLNIDAKSVNHRSKKYKRKKQKDANNLIRVTIQHIEECRIQIREQHLIDSEITDFRQQYCQYMTNLKRMLLLLSELYNIEEKIDL